MTSKNKPVRARTKKGYYKADDPSTPDINEAYVQAYAQDEKPAPAPSPAPAPAPKATGSVWFESREKEPSMFEVAGIGPIRNFSSGRLEWEVPASDLDRFTSNHFVNNGRVVRKI